MNEDNNISKAFYLINAIKDKVKKSDKVVENRVVDMLVEKQVAARANKLVKALETISSLQKDLEKLKGPDNILYNADGKVTQELFSKERINQIKEHTKKIEKLHKTINNALNGDWSQLQ